MVLATLAAALSAWNHPVELLGGVPQTVAPRRYAHIAASLQCILQTNGEVDFDTLGAADNSPVGVLLLSVGAPETADDVEVSMRQPCLGVYSITSACLGRSSITGVPLQCVLRS